jgi:hypothetical protein
MKRSAQMKATLLRLCRLDAVGKAQEEELDSCRATGE